ncbi:MAG: hypothetical protein NW703_03685 [Nitrospiraceae bacterium]
MTRVRARTSWIGKWTRIGCLMVVVIMGTAVASAHALRDDWLITPEEAAMAPAPEGPGGEDISVGAEAENLGPQIDVVKPTNGGSVPPPVEVDVRFIPKTSPVDVASLKVSVVKFINIDITDRVRAHTTVEGIHVPGAQIPSGKHTVRISIADKDGLRSIMDVTFEVL